MMIKDGWWHVAYRRKPEGTILDDQKSTFNVIPNTWKYCAMDPFVFEHDGLTYVFAEVYSIFHQRGLLGYSVLTDGKWSKWKPVIVEKHHLSYPFIFEENGDIFIIPEAYGSGEVYAYRAVAFPNKWERAYTLKSGVKYVDTTLLIKDGEKYAFSYDISDQQEKKLLLYKMKGNVLEDDSCKVISRDDSVARPGGRIFWRGDKLIRVSQDCDGSYGKALVFSGVGEDIWNDYNESVLLHFGVEDINLDKKMTVEGIHQYSATEQFEVVDLKGKIIHPVSLVIRTINKVRKLLGLK